MKVKTQARVNLGRVQWSEIYLTGNGEPLRDFKQGVSPLRLRSDLSNLFK